MKGFKPTEWSRAIVSPISTMVTQAVDGLSGKNRRKVQMLKGALEAAEGECDRLRREMQELVQYTDAELDNLKQEIEHITQERDELQLQVLILEEEKEVNPRNNAVESQELSNLLSINSTTSEEPLPSPSTSHSQPSYASTPPHSSQAKPVAEVENPITSGPQLLDLSGFRIALVGGHPTTRRGVIQELQLHYGLKHVVEIPRMSEVNTSRTRVKSKIYRCNLVVLITGYMSHRLTEIVFSLKDAGALAGDVLQLNCKGKSGVLRGILEHVESRTT